MAKMKAHECPVPKRAYPGYKVTPEGEWLVLDKCPLTRGERWLDSFLVHYPVGIEYNGGTIHEGKWYRGFKVPAPTPPKGFKLTGIGIGLQLNAHPPYATVYLEPEND